MFFPDPTFFQESAHAAFNGFASGFERYFNNSNISSMLTKSVVEISTNLFQMMPNAEEIGNQSGTAFVEFMSSATQSAGLNGKEIGTKLSGFVKNVAQGTGWSGENMGDGLGTSIHDFFGTALKNSNMPTLTRDFMKTVSDSFKEGVTGLDMKGNMEHFNAEFTDGANIFRGTVFGQIDGIRDDIQSIFSNIARDVTLEAIPWVALGGAILVGTPLLVHYLYKKAIHNMTRPVLAQEVRRVSLLDRTKDRLTSGISEIWKSSVIGIKRAAIVGSAGLTLSFFGAILSNIVTGNGSFFGETLSGVGCYLGLGSYRCNPTSALPLIALTVGAGYLSTGVDLGRKIYQHIQKLRHPKPEPVPIFSAKLQKRIDQLTQATYNIKKNGGFLQNVLLYGPGGTGKTMISKYMAKNSTMNYVMMSGGDLAQYIQRGEHVTEINKLFNTIQNSNSPTILFIDECESLCGDRGKMDRSQLIELVNAFLNKTGEPSKKLMVILTTNRKEDLDPAVLSRMDHKLYIGPPEENERRIITEQNISTFMTKQEKMNLFTHEVISDIARRTEGFTGRTLFKMFNTLAGLRASSVDNTLTLEMLEETLQAFIEQEAQIQV